MEATVGDSRIVRFRRRNFHQSGKQRRSLQAMSFIQRIISGFSAWRRRAAQRGRDFLRRITRRVEIAWRRFAWRRRSIRQQCEKRRLKDRRESLADTPSIWARAEYLNREQIPQRVFGNRARAPHRPVRTRPLRWARRKYAVEPGRQLIRFRVFFR